MKYKCLIILILGSIFLYSCTYKAFYPYKFEEKLEVSNIKTNWEDSCFISDGYKIRYLLLQPESRPVKASVFFTHGNRGNRYNWKKIIMPMVDSGYQVFIWDFRAYGNSEGTPNHQNTKKDVRVGFDFFLKHPKITNTSILVMGVSLGGNISIELAKERQSQIDLLITEATFTSYKKEAIYLAPIILKPISLIVSNPYKAYKLINEIKIPKLLVRSPDDKTVPFYMGKELYEKAVEPKFFLQVSGRHTFGMLLHSEKYIEQLEKILETHK